MAQESFTAVCVVDKTPAEVTAAINNVRGWWSGQITGDTDRIDAEFTYSVPGVHRSTQKITEIIPNKKIVWHVRDASLSFIKEEDEWKGTDIIFEIVAIGTKTEVRFEHKGLVPDFECYDACSNAWNLLINGNLFRFIMTGEIQPSPW